MKDLPGDVDYAAELKGRTDLLDSYDHGSVTDRMFMLVVIYIELQMTTLWHQVKRMIGIQ